MQKKLLKLKKLNLFMGMFHFIQGLFMLFVALNFKQVIEFKPEIFSNFLKFDTASLKLINEPKLLFSLPFGVFVSSFLLISAAFHFMIVSKKLNGAYNNQIENRFNMFRWYEYSISSSIMIVLIGVLFGINDIGTLLLLFGLNASMNLFGLLMEKININRKKADWSSFVFGSIAGIIPWIVITMFAFGNSNPSQIPWFVYAIFSSYFIFFNLFPINMILHYKQIGKWKDYLYGEKIYIILSLVAKSILAWLVFFGVMQP